MAYENKTPEIGMGVTHVMWSDRHAYTVIAVSPSGKRCTIQRDTAIRTDQNGMSDAQSYRYEPNPQGATRVITLRRDERWRAVGEEKGSSVYHVGYRDEHYDYTF